MDKILKNLVESGLNEKEAAVYYASLSLGPSPVLRISKSAGINRATTYSVIDSLIVRGLMRTEEKGFKKVFVAEDPENLKQVMEKKMEKVESIIPDLTELYKTNGKVSLIKTYEGITAVNNVYRRFMRDQRSSDFYYFIGGSLGWKTLNPEEQEKYFKWRSRMRFDTRLIFEDSERAKLHKSLAQALHQKVKVFTGNISFESDIMITPYMVAIMKISHPARAIVIEDMEIVRSYKTLFEFIWNVVPE